MAKAVSDLHRGASNVAGDGMPKSTKKRRGQQEGSIFQESPGKWRAVASLGFRHGRRARKTFTASTRKEVQGKLTKALRDHHLRVQCGRREADCPPVASGVVGTSCQAIREAQDLHLLRVHHSELDYAVPRKRSAAELTPTRIQMFLKDRTDSGLAPKTHRHIHRTLTSALAVAEGFGYVPRNVSKLVAPVHVPKTAVRFLTGGRSPYLSRRRSR